MWETVPLVLKCLPYHNFKKEWKSSCNKKNEKQVNKTLMSAIMFSTNAMKQQTDKLVLENIYSKTHKFTRPLKAIHVTLTAWIVDPFPQVKSAEHMAKNNTKIIFSDRSHFPIFLENCPKNI